MNAWAQLGVFLGQATIIVAAILIVATGVLAIACKNKLKDRKKIRIKKLNKSFEEMREELNDEILSKAEKKQIKKDKKLAKKQAKAIEKQRKKGTDKTPQTTIKTPCKRIFVLNFQGDLRATHTTELQNAVSAILSVATPNDEVLLKLESAGGVVHGYGLAASQLQRIKDRGIKLLVSVDKVAASGGYLMACVADKLLAAPFAIIGSIGVIAQLPNFHRFLKKHNVDFEQITAGEYKRTLTLFGENTEKGREKLQDDINEVHKLFKDFIKEHRPQVDLSKVATGEYWYGKQALEKNLVDELITSDDYLMGQLSKAKLFEVQSTRKKSLIEKLIGGVETTASRLF